MDVKLPDNMVQVRDWIVERKDTPCPDCKGPMIRVKIVTGWTQFSCPDCSAEAVEASHQVKALERNARINREVPGTTAILRSAYDPYGRIKAARAAGVDPKYIIEAEKEQSRITTKYHMDREY